MHFAMLMLSFVLHTSSERKKTGRETISLKLNDPLKNRYEPSKPGAKEQNKGRLHIARMARKMTTKKFIEKSSTGEKCTAVNHFLHCAGFLITGGLRQAFCVRLV